MTASTPLRRLSTRCCNIAAGTCFHSAERTLERSSNDVGAIRPDSQSAFQFIPKVVNGVEVRALCRPVKFFNTDQTNKISIHWNKSCLLYTYDAADE